MKPSLRGLNTLQKISMSLMGILTIMTFVAANLHAVLWQSSEWLVSTVLPAVVVELTNEERIDSAVTPLQRNSTLDEAAKLKAEHMAENEYFAHFSPDGVSPWHWFDESGYVYAHAGENLAIHFTDSNELVDAWMDSPTHKENIVNGVYSEIGVGTAKGEFEGYDTVYVVQLFGTPGIPVTSTASVTEVKNPLVIENEILPPVTTSSEIVSTETVADPVPLALETVSNESLLAELLPVAEIDIETTEVAVAETKSEFEIVLPADTGQILIDDEFDIKPVEELAVLEGPEEQTIKVEELTLKTETIVAAEDTVFIETSVLKDSSGLAIAEVTVPKENYVGPTVASIATQPNELLQIVYIVLSLLVFMMLTVSVVLEVRNLNYLQVTYSLALLFGMGGLWYTHSILTTGAVIV